MALFSLYLYLSLSLSLSILSRKFNVQLVLDLLDVGVEAYILLRAALLTIYWKLNGRSRIFDVWYQIYRR